MTGHGEKSSAIPSPISDLSPRAGAAGNLAIDRRRFLQIGPAGAVGAALGWSTTADPVKAASRAQPELQALPANALDGHTPMAEFLLDSTPWLVYEDLRMPTGALTFVSDNGSLTLKNRLEPVFDQADAPWFGMKFEDVARADKDLLAERLLAGGDPDPDAVRLAAPPPASAMDPQGFGGSTAWNTFVGTKLCADTMPVFLNGRTRTYRPEFDFPELWQEEPATRRMEGLLGGWLPAVHKQIPIAENAYFDVIVFGDVAATDEFTVQTWHRTMRIENGRVVKAVYGYSYPAFGTRRKEPEPAAFYGGLFCFAAFWQNELHDAAAVQLPDSDWTDMARHAFAKELITRPRGIYPKYGAVNREYYGCEYDGFQDTFTSSLYANLEWGRFDQAAAVFDGYLNDFVEPNGMIDMRGPGVAQFGLSLSLAARYLQYTGDLALLRKHKVKIEGWAELLVELHDESLALPDGDAGHGLIHGWSESDSSLFRSPMTWWQPYFSNSAFPTSLPISSSTA